MLVSLIITSYNYARYLERAIRSALNQSLEHNNFEVIVVDDCSKDESHMILDNYCDEIRTIRFSENKGLSAARNAGIKKAKGQYILFLDADDYLHSDTLKVLSVFLTENNRLDAVAVDYYLVNEFGDHIEWVSSSEKPIACGIMFRKDRLFDIGLYDEKFRAREEEDLRKRFLVKNNIYHIPLPLYRYRMHDNNLTKNKKEMDKHAEMLKKKHKP
ncbi:MAG: glycosyltransferase family 2 protein [Bacteroidia bacterium]|nr:glycosyltransferase family 2 protein [Bacteroidia bacterium]